MKALWAYLNGRSEMKRFDHILIWALLMAHAALLFGLSRNQLLLVELAASKAKASPDARWVP